MESTATTVALIAPVPEHHLEDGADVSRRKGKVAFGSRAWEVFRQLDTLRSGSPVDVYLYASRSPRPGPPQITWHARYIRHVESVGGAHPDGMDYRPTSTAKNPDDNAGHWVVFWEVEVLRRLEPNEWIRISDLRGLDKPRYYPRDFVPEGPILIEHP
jgi:hypothetical protein